MLLLARSRLVVLVIWVDPVIMASAVPVLEVGGALVEDVRLVAKRGAEVGCSGKVRRHWLQEVV